MSRTLLSSPQVKCRGEERPAERIEESLARYEAALRRRGEFSEADIEEAVRERHSHLWDSKQIHIVAGMREDEAERQALAEAEDPEFVARQYSCHAIVELCFGDFAVALAAQMLAILCLFVAIILEHLVGVEGAEEGFLDILGFMCGVSMTASVLALITPRSQLTEPIAVWHDASIDSIRLDMRRISYSHLIKLLFGAGASIIIALLTLGMRLNYEQGWNPRFHSILWSHASTMLVWGAIRAPVVRDLLLKCLFWLEQRWGV